MTRIHDLGGMQGFGEINFDGGDEVFHESWEARAFGIMRSLLANEVYKLDEFRHAVERLAPADYLSWSYYERWLYALEKIAVEKGVLERGAVDKMMQSGLDDHHGHGHGYGQQRTEGG